MTEGDGVVVPVGGVGVDSVVAGSVLWAAEYFGSVPPLWVGGGVTAVVDGVDGVVLGGVVVRVVRRVVGVDLTAIR